MHALLELSQAVWVPAAVSLIIRDIMGPCCYVHCCMCDMTFLISPDVILCG